MISGCEEREEKKRKRGTTCKRCGLPKFGEYLRLKKKSEKNKVKERGEKKKK